MLTAWQSIPRSLFVLPKRERAVDGPREKTPGTNLRVRTSSLKYGRVLNQYRL